MRDRFVAVSHGVNRYEEGIQEIYHHHPLRPITKQRRSHWVTFHNISVKKPPQTISSNKKSVREKDPSVACPLKKNCKSFHINSKKLKLRLEDLPVPFVRYESCVAGSIYESNRTHSIYFGWLLTRRTPAYEINERIL